MLARSIGLFESVETVYPHGNVLIDWSGVRLDAPLADHRSVVTDVRGRLGRGSTLMRVINISNYCQKNRSETCGLNQWAEAPIQHNHLFVVSMAVVGRGDPIKFTL